jgi:hypothetical protein
LFSCGDVGTSQSSDIDEGNNNVEEEAAGLNEPPPELAPQRKPTQQNVQTPEAVVKEDVGDVQPGDDDKDENNQHGLDAPARSDQSKPRDLTLQQRGIEAKGKKKVAKIDDKEKKVVAKDEAKKVNIKKKVEEKISKIQPKK